MGKNKLYFFVPVLILPSSLSFTLILLSPKTICYSRLPTSRNEDGLVALQFKKTEQELLLQQDFLTTSLQDIVAQPTVQVKLDSVRPLPDNW